eukprot:186432_1
MNVSKSTFSNSPNLEIMPSGVPQSFCMHPSKYHESQLRTALVELKMTLERMVQHPMVPDATVLIERAVHEIKRNKQLLNQTQIYNSTVITNSQFGVSICGSSPTIPMPSIDSASSELDCTEDQTMDSIDWDNI